MKDRTITHWRSQWFLISRRKWERMETQDKTEMGVHNEHLNRSSVTGFNIKTVEQNEELACLPLSFNSHVFPKAKDLSKCKIDMIAAAPIEANQRPEDSALEINDFDVRRYKCPMRSSSRTKRITTASRISTITNYSIL
jgi:hypothetical protein